MKYYIISGESSGDLYGSYLIDSIREIDQNSTFFCWGGDYMKEKGVQMIKTLDKLSFMGFWEVFKNIFTVINNLQIVKKDLKLKKPDCVILIDYPGFNFKVAKYANRLKIPVFWFVAPQTWAWNESRIKKIKQYIDRLYVILPFEKNYFASKKVYSEYFGHPLIEVIKDYPSTYVRSKKIIALFPGSRKQEIKKMLPNMLKLTSYFRDYEFIIGGSKNISIDFYKKIIKSNNVKLVFNQNYDLMKLTSAAVVTSGTITLELAIHKVPQVVCYRTSLISYLIAKKVIKTKYISLVNIILNKKVVDELIQDNFNVENLIMSLEKSLNKNHIEKTMEDYNTLICRLDKKPVFENIAQNLFSFLKNN
jgi:lipid-A-disaccharide synthase